MIVKVILAIFARASAQPHSPAVPCRYSEGVQYRTQWCNYCQWGPRISLGQRACASTVAVLHKVSVAPPQATHKHAGGPRQLPHLSVAHGRVAAGCWVSAQYSPGEFASGIWAGLAKLLALQPSAQKPEHLTSQLRKPVATTCWQQLGSWPPGEKYCYG